MFNESENEWSARIIVIQSEMCREGRELFLLSGSKKTSEEENEVIMYCAWQMVNFNKSGYSIIILVIMT